MIKQTLQKLQIKQTPLKTDNTVNQSSPMDIDTQNTNETGKTDYNR